MSIKITKLGIIKGGVCERAFKERRQREQGARLHWDWLLSHNCVKVKNGWYRIIKECNKSWRWAAKNIGRLYGADTEIGWLRFKQDIVPQLFKNKRSFRLKWMEKWIYDIASFELGMCSKDSEPLTEAHALGAGESRTIIGYAPPHQPELYKKWNRRAK